MKLIDYVRKNSKSFKQIEQELTDMFGNSPKRTTIHAIAYEQAMPTLEVALMLSRWSNGKVEPYEFLYDAKRKYTKEGSPIYVVFSTGRPVTVVREKEEDEDVDSLLKLL